MKASLPVGFAVRPPEVADLPALRRLVAACGNAEYGAADEAMIKGVEMTWQKAGFARTADACAVVAPDGRLAAYGHVGPTDRTHLYAHVFVHPDLTGRGIGSWLLVRIETRARERQAEISASDGDATLEQWVGATNCAARELLASAGYAEVRHIWGMVIALGDAPGPSVWPDGITIRAVESDDDACRVHAASEEAFREEWHHEPRTFDQFMAEEKATERFDLSLWFAAWEGDEVVGMALCEAYSARGWVNTVGVRPAWRGRGIATALLRHAFAEFRRRGLSEAALGVDAQNPSGATRVYERAGMRVERQYDVFEKGL